MLRFWVVIVHTGCAAAAVAPAVESPDGSLPPDAMASEVTRRDTAVDVTLADVLRSPADTRTAVDTAGNEAAPPAPPCPGAARFCEGFESFAVGAAPGAPWTRRTEPGNAVAVDDGRFFSGTKAARFTAPAGNFNRAEIKVTTAALPIAGNAFFGRMMVFLTALQPATGVHATLLAASDLRATQMYRYGIATTGTLSANYQHDGPACNQQSRQRLPTGKWACLEWQFDGPGASLRLWLDGIAVTTASVTRFSDDACHDGVSRFEWTAPTFEALTIGWENYQPTTAPTELWIDDLVVDTTRVGCPGKP